MRTIIAENRYAERMFSKSTSTNCGHSLEANTVCIPLHRSDLNCAPPPPIKPFVFQPQAQVHGKVSYSPHTPFPSTGSRTRGFKAKALRARCIVCDEPSGATAHENCTLVFCFFSPLFFFFFKAAPEADVLSSIQTQLQMKRRNIGGQSPVRWSKNEDLRGGKTTCGKKEIRRSR